MKKKGKKHPLVGILFRSVIQFLSRFSLGWTYRFGVVIGWGLWLIPNSLKQLSSENINRAYPSCSLAQRRLLLRNSLIELGKGFCELRPLWCWSRKKLLPLVRDKGGVGLINEALER